MAAITAIAKMRCVRLQPAAGGSPEVVELLEKHGVVANTNLHVLNTNWPKPAKALQLVIDNPVAQGSFKIGQAYKVEFTEISGDVVQEPSSA